MPYHIEITNYINIDQKIGNNIYIITYKIDITPSYKISKINDKWYFKCGKILDLVIKIYNGKEFISI